jgi:hypothetical protein
LWRAVHSRRTVHRGRAVHLAKDIHVVRSAPGLLLDSALCGGDASFIPPLLLVAAKPLPSYLLGLELALIALRRGLFGGTDKILSKEIKDR